jgi:cytochrome c55X
MTRFCRLAPALLILATVIPAEATETPACAGRVIDDPAHILAWKTLRVVDCARCHGRNHEGLAAPSIVAYVRSQSRASFDRIVLDGDPPRGMPGYRDNTLVADAIEPLYLYFLARAGKQLCADARPRVQVTPAAPR